MDTMKKFKLEQKKRQFLSDLDSGVKYVQENIVGIAMLASIGVPIVCAAIKGVAGIEKSAINGIASKEAVRDIECRHYDNRTSTYYTSKRPLTSNEKMELDRRYQKKEGTKGEILDRMGLLARK